MDELLKQIDNRYTAVDTITSRQVEMDLCWGGGTDGIQNCSNFSGYIVVQKPEKILVVLKLPVVGSAALNMASDGRAFKMKVPPYNCAIVGSDEVTSSSQKGIYALRPSAILDSMLIRGIRANQVVSMTQDSRTLPDPKNRKSLMLEPDYDIEFLSQPAGQIASTLRVLHTSRVNLLPYRQDIYNPEGKIVTTAFYSNYQKFGDINFPTKIEIQRPLDELKLTITLSKTVFNQTLPADQFDIDIPATYKTYKMDDPSIAATVPCGAHATQSPH